MAPRAASLRGRHLRRKRAMGRSKKSIPMWGSYAELDPCQECMNSKESGWYSTEGGVPQGTGKSARSTLHSPFSARFFWRHCLNSIEWSENGRLEDALADLLLGGACFAKS